MLRLDLSPGAVAALVPALRGAAAAALGADALRLAPDQAWSGCDVALSLAAFAARLLREEEQ